MPPVADAADRASASRIVDLSHVVRHGMVTYPGLPGPELSDYLSRAGSRERYAPGTEFHIGRITMVANTGTYLDAPFHRFADGADVSQLPLSQLVDVEGVIVDATRPGQAALGPEVFAQHQCRGLAVLIRTGWCRHWGTQKYGSGGHPFVSESAAAWLAEQGPAVVGTDAVNIDDMADPARPAHTRLLLAGIPIVEHLRGLDQLPETGFRFYAAPVAVAGLGTFPVRAYALAAAPHRRHGRRMAKGRENRRMEEGP
jgi:kynurenine formamidase